MVTILRRRSIGVTAIVVATVGLLCACSNDGGKTVSMDVSRKEAESIRQTVFDVAGSTWPDSSREATPAPTVCTFNGDTDGGVQLHYRALGSPPADPKAYIEAVSRALRDRALGVSTSEMEYGKYGTLYQVVSRDEGRPSVVATANKRTATVTIDTACVPGNAEDYSSGSDEP